MAQKIGMSFGWPHRESQSLLGGWDCRDTVVVPLLLDWGRCTSLKRSGWQEQVGTDRTGTDRTGTQGQSCPLSFHTDPQPLHTASFPRRSPGCSHGWDDPQPGWHSSQSTLHLFKDFHLRISCQAKVTDNRVMTRICWNTLRLFFFSTLGC